MDARVPYKTQGQSTAGSQDGTRGKKAAGNQEIDPLYLEPFLLSAHTLKQSRILWGSWPQKPVCAPIS